jgi:hypothetical protein
MMSHTLELPDEVYKLIEAYAASRGQTPAEAVGEWAEANANLEDLFDEQRIGNPAFDPWAGFRGISQALSPDTIERHDKYLAAEYEDSHER